MWSVSPDCVCWGFSCVQKLGACPEAVQRLLGLDQCSWGPAYWCKNVETASRCNVSIACNFLCFECKMLSCTSKTGCDVNEASVFVCCRPWTTAGVTCGAKGRAERSTTILRKLKENCCRAAFLFWNQYLGFLLKIDIWNRTVTANLTALFWGKESFYWKVKCIMYFEGAGVWRDVNGMYGKCTETEFFLLFCWLFLKWMFF